MKPYVYIIQNLERTHWYVGMRSANECPANEDTGYWGSSKYLKKLIKNTGKENWTKTIVAEFDTWQEAKAHEDELLELMWDWDGRVNKAVNGFIDMSDPEVKEKQKAGCRKKAQDPEHRAKKKAGCQKRSENSEWRANQKAGSQKRSENPEYRANQKAGVQKALANPFIATKIDTGEEFYCESGRCDQAKALNLNPGAVFSWLRGTYPCPNYKGFTFRYV